ncbi:MAG: WecB/TagA/CpsF family glycosyltransferase [bacterium]|nr:WecB/TagA/CpsF family glycosyltransferase [bacterium]
MIDTRTGLRRARILGTPVDRCTRIEFRMFIRRSMSALSARRIVTLNPEIALQAWRDPRYGVAIRTADLLTIDGAGVALALRCLGFRGHGGISGSDVLNDLATLAREQGKTIAFLLRDDGLTSPPLLRAALGKQWPSLQSTIGAVDIHQPIDPALARAMTDAAPDILIVNFGHPYQEQWLASNLDRFPSIRLAAGIGGALDYFSGTIPSPPYVVRSLGIEWLWRLLRQPFRLRRILRAVIVFPSVVAWDAAHRWARMRSSALFLTDPSS